MGHHFDMVFPIVEAGDVVVFLAAVFEEDVPVLQLDFLQGFQAVGGEAGADHIDLLEALVGHRREGFRGIGLQPGLASEAGLVAQRPLIRREAEDRGQQMSRAHALVLVRVAELDIALRQAVEGHQQEALAPLGLPVLLDGIGESQDVIGMPVIVADEIQVRSGARFPQYRGQMVEAGGGGGGRVLRIQGQHHQALVALVQQAPDHLLEGRFAVAHHQFDANTVAEALLQGLLLSTADCQQRGAVVGPDLVVGLESGLAAKGENHPVEKRPPQHARNLHHARIGQELPEKAAHLAAIVIGRSAEIGQDDCGLFRAHVRDDGRWKQSASVSESRGPANRATVNRSAKSQLHFFGGADGNR